MLTWQHVSSLDEWAALPYEVRPPVPASPVEGISLQQVGPAVSLSHAALLRGHQLTQAQLGQLGEALGLAMAGTKAQMTQQLLAHVLTVCWQ